MNKVNKFLEKLEKTTEDTFSGYQAYSSKILSFATYCSPFYNCQNFSIAKANDLIEALKGWEHEDLKELLRQIGYDRMLCIIDINESYYSLFEELFAGFETIVNEPYVSSNKSDMRLIYFRILTNEEVSEEDDEEEDDNW